MAVDLKQEYKSHAIIRDTRHFGARVTDFLGDSEQAAFVLAGMAGAAFFLPWLTDVIFFAGLVLALYARRLYKKRGLTMRMPRSSGLIDPKEISLKDGSPQPAAGIVYLGNDQDTGDEVWLSDTQARTHMLFMGTTGSGKALSDRSPVLTPAGWKPMGEVREGDALCIPGGGTTTVKGVYPQGRKRMYLLRLRLSDTETREVECCEEHLWLARETKPDTDPLLFGEGTRRTDEIMQSMRAGSRFRLPVTVVETDTETNAVRAGAATWAELVAIQKGSYQPSRCILVGSKEHLFITGDPGDPHTGIVTHNTEFLISLVYNALIHGSGFIYVDGKADSSLYGKVYSMARAMGREDDVLVINFQTGARDIFGAQPNKMSNTMNAFAVGSSGMLTQLVVSLMSTGKGDMWEGRAISFVEALMKPLVFLRDNHGLLLDVDLIRQYFELGRIEELVWREAGKYDGLEQTLDGLRSYVVNLPNYDRNKYQRQSETTNEQHGFITMQLIRTFNSLADTYGYIMRTQLAEIDFLDVFLNRRILVVLLPALEKSPAELTNLGRIIVAAIKATMAVGLGAQIEGKWAEVIDSKPTNSPSPFMCVLDEYGYYAVEGFAVVPAQARSLGFSAIFAGQDLPAFQKASEKEAESTLANTNSKFCGKLECTKTYDYFSKLAGQGYFTKTSGFQSDPSTMSGAYRDSNSASIERMDRVNFEDLRGQVSGQWHMFFANTIVKLKSFYAAPKTVTDLRVNHFIKVGRPRADEVANYRNAITKFQAAVHQPHGLDAALDTVPMRDLAVIADGFERATGVDALRQVIAAAVFLDTEEARRFQALDRMLQDARHVGPASEAGGDEDFDYDRVENDGRPLVDPDDDAEDAEYPGPDAADPNDVIDFTRLLHAAAAPTEEEEFGTSGDEQAADDGEMDQAQGYGDAGTGEAVTDDRVGDESESGYADYHADGGDWFDAAFDAPGTEGSQGGRRICLLDAGDVEPFEGMTVLGVNPEVDHAIDVRRAEELDELPAKPSKKERGDDGLGRKRGRKKAGETPRAPGQGLLDRAHTKKGLEEIEGRLAATGLGSLESAEATIETIAEATRYPLTQPSLPVDPTDFMAIARRLADVLDLQSGAD